MVSKSYQNLVALTLKVPQIQQFLTLSSAETTGLASPLGVSMASI